MELPEKIDKIDDYAFASCGKLSSIGKNADDDKEKSVREVGEGAFFRCLNLHTNFKDIEKLGKDSFHWCCCVREVFFKDGIEEIPVRAFSNCTSLTKVVFPKSVRKIGILAFCNCHELVSITFENKIEKIENYAFAECTNLSFVKPELKPDSYAVDAFKGCFKKFDKSTNSSNFNILDEQFILNDEDNTNMVIEGHPIMIEDKSEVPLFSEGGPKVEDIAQGKIRDCWLLAALGSIASFRPEFLQYIMTDNPESGTVSVRLQREIQPGEFRSEVYTVKKSIFKSKVIDGDKAIMSKLQGCIWPQMMEKAFSAYWDSCNVLIDFNNVDGYRDNIFSYREPFKVILGKYAESSGEYNQLSGDPKELFEKIQRNLKNRMPIILAVTVKFNDLDGDEVQNQHGYSLVGAEEGKGKYYIKLRNPCGYNWDKNHNKKDAVITVDLEEVIRVGSWILNLYE